MTNHRVLVGASAGTHAVACMVDAWHREAPAFGHIGRKVPVIAAALMVAFAAPPQTSLALGALEGKLRIAQASFVRGQANIWPRPRRIEIPNVVSKVSLHMSSII